ncbi:hypothetical protein MMC11_005549 [Xylographa trunciseda]|nr:hypothetical protein [Xylographa trunciseda]
MSYAVLTLAVFIHMIDLREQAGMADTFNGDFARLVPRNQNARRLFAATYLYVEKNKTFHMRFLQRNIDSNEVPVASDKPVESSTDYDSQLEGETEGLQIEDSGYFVLSFDGEREPEFPLLGWRVGRGATKSPANRGVDLLLSRPSDQRSRSLASVHMIFYFNRQSGLLMFKGGSHKAPVEYRMGDTWVKLGYDEGRLVYEPWIKIRAGTCEYELEHTVEEKYRASYFDRRDMFLKAQLPDDSKFLIRALQRMPGDSYVLRGQYLELETRGAGAFGWITQGLDTKTGAFVAVKELRIEKRNRNEVMAEVNMGTRFTNEPGLLPTLSAICEHGRPEICCNLERFFLFMPSAISDFTVGFWENMSISQPAKLQFLREPLEGVKTLHAMGIMHRDIRPKNMLIMSNDPPRAALCDFGKAIKAKTSKVTTIGPIHTLAPEVWTVAKDGPYTAKIDTWAYGYAIAELLGYKPRDNSKITQERLVSILRTLRASYARGTDGEPLVDLVSKLLVWRPRDRWSAEQALEHKCWLPIALEQDRRYDDPTEVTRGKRALLEDPRSDSHGMAKGASSTQEFSQETKNVMQKMLAPD